MDQAVQGTASGEETKSGHWFEAAWWDLSQNAPMETLSTCIGKPGLHLVRAIKQTNKKNLERSLM